MTMMRVQATKLAGLRIIEHEPMRDERGSFERWWCEPSFAEFGCAARFTQMSLSRNSKRGTLRGLHVALGAAAETKLVRCVRGSVYDVVADVRPDSPQFGQWECVLLTAGEPRALLIDPGLAHGFITREDESELLYLLDTPYVADAARTISYQDPALHIAWPIPVEVISARDADAASLAAYVRELQGIP